VKVYKNAVIITALISLLALFIAYVIKNTVVDSSLYDILVGIFSSSIVAFIIYTIEYRVKRQETLETFYLYAFKHIKEINKMDKSLTVNKKVDMYLDFINSDLPDLGTAYNNIDFIFDCKKESKLYIYNNIYNPIKGLEEKISSYYWNFAWHKDGSGRNSEVMGDFIDEIEGRIFEVKSADINKKTEVTGSHNKFCKEIRNELSGKYYKLMYNKNIEKN